MNEQEFWEHTFTVALRSLIVERINDNSIDDVAEWAAEYADVSVQERRKRTGYYNNYDVKLP